MKSIIMAFIFSLSVFNANAVVDKKIQNSCSPIKKQMCTKGECSKVNELIQEVFNECTFSYNDIREIQESSDFMKVVPKTKTGFNVIFSKMFGKIGSDFKLNNQNSSYENIKKNYESIKIKYNNYEQIKGQKIIKSAQVLPDKYEVLKYETLRKEEDEYAELARNFKKVEFILKSESDFQKYKATYLKFLPEVYIESQYYKFEFKKFSLYECTFLSLMTEMQDLQEKLGFDCARN